MHQDEALFRAELVAAFRRERQRSAVYGDARDCRTFGSGAAPASGARCSATGSSAAEKPTTGALMAAR
jgi:hypothetical protein